MAKKSQMPRLRSIYKTTKDLRRDIQMTHDSEGGMKKLKTLIRLEKHINKAIKGFRSISRSTTSCTHKRGKKYKIMKIDDKGLPGNGDDRFCDFGIIPTKRRSGLAPSDTPDIPIENIKRAFGFTCNVPLGFSMRIKEAVLIRKGFGKNRYNSEFNEEELIAIENNIHHLACYYTRTKILPPDWKYDPMIASTL